LSGIPSLYSEKIHYYELGTFEETIRKEKYLYDHNRGIPTFQRAQDEKMKGMMEQRKKCFQPPFYRNIS